MQQTRGVSSGPRETGGSEQSHSGGKASNIWLRKCGAQFQAIAPGAVGKISGGRLAAGGGSSPRRGFPGGRARPAPAPPAPAPRAGSPGRQQVSEPGRESRRQSWAQTAGPARPCGAAGVQLPSYGTGKRPRPSLAACVPPSAPRSPGGRMPPPCYNRALTSEPPWGETGNL